MRPGVTRRLGVDYESVKKRNPRIVYGSISGFGQYGPYTARPSIDQIAQGMTGIMSVTGIPGQGPVRVGVAVTDIMAGAFLAQGVLIALLDREVSGEGRWVQTSLIEAGITLLDFQATRWLVDKQVPPQEGNYHPTNTPMGLYPTADSFLNLAATSNKNFQKFCKLIGREKMATDPRFATTALRGRNKEALNELIATALRAKTSREWFDTHGGCGYSLRPGLQHQGRVRRPAGAGTAHRAIGDASPPWRNRSGGAALRDDRLRPRDPDGHTRPRRTQRRDSGIAGLRGGRDREAQGGWRNVIGNRSPGEAQRNPEGARVDGPVPDYAALHPGYAASF